jgi:ferric-dicitrate binding protein FerR (iron transport regulator)
MSSLQHPARSLDFLSRLHDGELSPAERAHFESHRAHCGECRKAAAEFENALAVYRTAGTSPPPSDLAARILRRLESSNRRRSPFGVVFGIDLRWAGAFTAALVVVIFGYLVLDRREASRRIPISFAQPTPGASVSLPSAPPPELQDQAAPRPEAKTAPKESVEAPLASSAVADEKRTVEAAPQTSSDRLASAAPAPKPLAESGPPEAKPSRALARAKQEDPSPAAVKEALSEERLSNRILVTALDGEGAAPAALNAEQLTLRREDHGRYVLIVGADGVPVEVNFFDEAAGKEKGGDLARSASEALRKLRFVPGTRPRRLLVAVESGS